MTQTETAPQKMENLQVDDTISPEVKKVKRVFFDIVNSVKGGSGKSTISLLLAAYCSSDEYFKDSSNEETKRRKAAAYIIDLDLKGTSWEKNYGHFITTKYYDPKDNITLYNYYLNSIPINGSTISSRNSIRYHQYPFFSTIMKDYKSFRSKSFWSEISFRVKTDPPTDDDYKIKICPASSTSGESINQIEVDIFENTLQQLILDILDSHLMNLDLGIGTEDEISADDIHIILDMPPSYEQHAEAVIKHLLTNSNSELYQKAQDKEGPFKKNSNDSFFKPYVINLFMPCSVSNAHIEQNGIYLWDWFQNAHYSDRVHDMLADNRLRVRYIINDISNYSPKIKKEYNSSEEEWIKGIYAQLSNNGCLYYTRVQDTLIKRNAEPYQSDTKELRFMMHMDHLPGAANLLLPFANIPDRPPLQIDIKYLESIKKVVSDLFFH